MKRDKRLLLFLALFLVGSLLFISGPASDIGNSDFGKSLTEAVKALQQELLALAGDGFVGITHSETDDEVIVFVEDEQTKQRVPHSFENYTVRTEITGRIQTLPAQLSEPVTDVSENRQGDVRPLVGGTSLSAYVTTGPLVYLYAGTMGMVTYDDKILSNAHVIAMEPGTAEFLDIGTPIIQPGSRDGGRLVNQVGELEAYIPIDFEPEAENYADAAICTIDPGVDASPGEQFFEEGNYWVEGWTEVSEGDMVRKSGRTTGVTTGEVIHTNASVLVWYGDQSALFVDQIVVTQDNWSFIAPGDSGSAVDKDGEFVGLIFAGSETCAVISKAEHIIEGLSIAFEPPEGQYSLTISSTPGGSITNPGERLFIYDAETVVELVAEAGEYYRFVEWTGDVDTIGNVYAASTNITMKDTYSVTANFELEEDWYSLIISSTEGGSITAPGEGTYIYEANTEVELVAEAGEHYQFVEWTGDVSTIGDVYAAATNITMNDSYSVTANFELEEGWYSLTISSTQGGSVTVPGEGTTIHPAGAVVNLVAQPEEGYQFMKWTGNVDTVADTDAARTTITMDESYSITANFESWHPEPWTLLVVSSSEGGSVTTPGEGIFLCPLGVEVSLVAKASSGYQFTSWSGHVNTIEDVNDASTSIIMDNSYSVTANFQGSGSGCCVATASCGNPTATELQILREFRDEYLLSSPLGEALVEFYYTVSPPMAEFITEHPSLKPVVRIGLVPAVAMSVIAINTAMLDKIAIICLVVLVLVSLAIWAKRRRGRGQQYTQG